jgi:hypothetical protein
MKANTNESELWLRLLDPQPQNSSLSGAKPEKANKAD